jgi:hypothetical protein
MRATLAALFAVAPFASARAQDPADEVALALLRREPAAAARAAARAEAPALRARLMAALQPQGERPAAMLAVARAFPADPEADRALVAGAAALLASAWRPDAVPELAAWAEIENDIGRDPEPLAPIVQGLGDAVAARRAVGGDPALLQEAERLLSLARVTRYGLWPVRVPAGAPWQRPAGQREPLELRLIPCEPGHLPWTKLDLLGAPAWTATLPVTGPVALPAIPVGDWLLEARSTTSPWRGVRRVLASDLEPVVLAQDGCLALAAFDPRGAAAATWEWWWNDTAVEHGELGTAPALVRLRETTLEKASSGELRLRGERGTSWLSASTSHDEADSGRWLVHVMVDRPVYRPGETVQGRLVLRTCRWDGEHFAAVPTTAPAENVPVTLVRDAGTADAAKQALRTDGNGLASFSFVVPAETPPGHNFDFAVEVPETTGKGEPLALEVRELCGVANLRRQAVLLAVDEPQSVTAAAEHVDVSARAEWSSGGPAAGLDVKAAINARDGWEREEAVALRTDAEGRATVRVPIASVGPRWVNVDFTVTGPDGKAVVARHMLKVVRPGGPDAKTEAEEWRKYPVPEIEVGEATVGAPCRVTLRGKPGLRVLVVVGRSHNARVRTATLDAAGVAAFDEPVQRCDWPRFDVAAATVDGRSDRDVPVHLRPMREVVLDVPAQAAPGQQTTVRAHGDAPGALVTFTVVDERIYELTADRTGDPEAAFRPWIHHPRWDPFDSPNTTTPRDLLESLLVHGRLPRLGWTRDLSARPSGGAGGASGPSAGAAVRSRFVPTAHFATVVADANGDAATTFRLPDDLTRWRVTAVVIGPDGMGAIVSKAFASRQPLAAEPVLPRAMRAGDAFSLPLAIDRAADATGPDAAVVTAATTGGALAVDRARTELAVPAGRVVPTRVPLRANAAGDATLQLAVELGPFADRSERAVTVGPDRVARPLVAAGSGTGELTVPLPAGASADAAVTVDVLQGGAEAWRLLEAELAEYPCGCAEQTLSRLLPRFALLRAAKAHGEALPALDVEFGRRLRMGLAHLRALQPDSSRQFAFWPGQKTEPGITGLVLHGLAVLRDGGFDLARSGLDLPDYYFRDDLPKQDGVYVVDAPFVMAAEKLAGAVRLFPKDDYARQLLAPALGLLPALPAGLCARMGLALLGAGDAAGARACRQRLTDGTLPALGPNGFPGEDPLAIAAMRLELDAALGVPAADLQRAAAELLLACLSGRGTTYGRACALSALAMVLPRTEGKPGTVVVEASGERRELALGGPAGASVRVRLPHAATVTVRGPADMPLLVRVATERGERASDHPAWATPVRLTRQWCDSRPDATWDERRDGTDLVPHQGPLLVGRPLVLRLVVTSPVPMRHVVVDCPLPAGFELPGAVEGVERFDDRVAFACDLAENVPQVLRLEVVPTVEGRFVWPPATAVPMYCSDSDGGTAGAWVEVAAVPPGGLPSFASCLLGPKPAALDVLDAPPDPLGDWCDTFGGAFDETREPERGITFHLLRGTAESWKKAPMWGESGPDEETRARLVEALWAKFPPADADLPRRLERLTDLLAGLELSADDGVFAERAWRPAAVARLQGVVQDLAAAVFAGPWPEERWAGVERAKRLGRSLGLCPASPARDALLARWWRKARECELDEGELLDLLRDNPADPALRAALRELATSVKGEAFGRVWARLGPDDRAALPPGLVLDAAPADAAGVIAAIAGSAAGRAELVLRLQSPGFVLSRFDRLEVELPAAVWASVPLAGYAGLATAAVAEEQDVTVDAVLAQLGSTAFPTVVLQRELAAAKVPAWRFLLARALRARGASAGDGAPAAWAQALALAPDDVAGARALLAAAKAREPGPDLAGEVSLLADFVGPVFVGHATPDQLYEARECLDTARWKAAWARLSKPDRVALLGHFHKHVGDQFVPSAADDAEALWQFALRSGDVDGPVDAMLQSAAGTDCLRRHLLAGDAGAHDAALRKAFAEALEVDERTLEPNPGEELPALLARLVHQGFAGAFSPDDAALLRRLRLHRGV